MQLRPAPEVAWPPARRSPRRRFAWAAAALLLLLAGGYGVWWLAAAAEFRDRAIVWIAERRAEGWQITYVDVSRRGFPLRLGLRFDKPVASDPAGVWTWSASRAKLTAPLTSERTLRLALGGEQMVDFTGDGAPRRWTGRAEQITLDLTPADGWMPNGRLAVHRLGMRGGSAGDDIGIGRLEMISLGDPAAAAAANVSTWGLRVNASDLRLPPAYAQTCGREVARLAIEAKLFGGLQPRPWPATLARWRDEGGVIEAQRLTLGCGPLTLDGEGTFALDAHGQPMGAMSTHIQGYEAVLDRLAAEHVINTHTAAAAKILLRALARSNADGASTLSAPLTLQDRALSVGPVTLLRLPELHLLDADGNRSGGRTQGRAGARP